MPFTPKERDLLRRELCRHFGEDPRIADGIFLRTWRGGERKGEPKILPAVHTMLDRGLVEIRPMRLGARAFFTEAGLQELRELLRDGVQWTPNGSDMVPSSRTDALIEPRSSAGEAVSHTGELSADGSQTGGKTAPKMQASVLGARADRLLHPEPKPQTRASDRRCGATEQVQRMLERLDELPAIRASIEALSAKLMRAATADGFGRT